MDLLNLAFLFIVGYLKAALVVFVFMIIAIAGHESLKGFRASYGKKRLTTLIGPAILILIISGLLAVSTKPDACKVDAETKNVICVETKTEKDAIFISHFGECLGAVFLTFCFAKPWLLRSFKRD